MRNDKDNLYEFIDISKEIKNTDYSDETLIDKVFLSNIQYKKFFGITFIEEKYRPWKRGIIKIMNRDENVSIQRMYMGASHLGISEGQFFVPRFSQNMLAIKRKSEQVFILKKGSKFLFYWQHPSHNVRASFKATFVLGIISIVLGIIGVIK